MAYLSPYGPISSCMLKADQRYAFLFYSTLEEAQQAINGMNGVTVEGSPIVAKLAANKMPSPGGPAPGGGGGGYAGVPPPPMAVRPHSGSVVPPPGRAGGFGGWTPGAAPGERVYIKGLPAGMTDESTRMLFAGYGSVTDSKVLVNDGLSNDGSGQSVAIVRMATVAEAKWLVDNLNGNIPETLDRPVEVTFAGARGPNGTPERSTPYGPGAGVVAHVGHHGMHAAHPGAPPPPVSRPPVWATAQAAVAPAAAFGAAPRATFGPQHSVHPHVQAMKGQVSPNCKLYIKGLPRTADDAYLFKVFAPWGRIVEAVACPKGDFCIGFVTYLSDEEAIEGINNVTGVTLLDGITLTVAVKAPK